MVLHLGIDGGGTGCRAAVADASGRILATGNAGPANINTDVQDAATNIMAATQAALARLPQAVDPATLTAVLGLAGGTIRPAVARLTALLPFARALVVNDAITAARGALGDSDGILVAIGTGSVYAVQRQGRLRQLGGRGFLLGDEGSGAVMGRALLAKAMRAADGFDPMTPLLATILDEFGGCEGIISFANTARPADFARLAPLIVNADDPAARAIFDAAVKGLDSDIAVLQQGARMPVVFSGGLGPFYARRLAAAWPQRPAKGTPLEGAVAMAIRLAAASDDPG